MIGYDWLLDSDVQWSPFPFNLSYYDMTSYEVFWLLFQIV